MGLLGVEWVGSAVDYELLRCKLDVHGWCVLLTFVICVCSFVLCLGFGGVFLGGLYLFGVLNFWRICLLLSLVIVFLSFCFNSRCKFT